MRFAIFAILIFLSTFNLYAQELREVTLQLKWNHQFQFAGYYAAIEKGYYKQAGLSVKLRELKESKDPYLDVLNKKAHFGIYTSELILKYNAGDPIVALAAIFQHSPFCCCRIKK